MHRRSLSCPFIASLFWLLLASLPAAPTLAQGVTTAIALTDQQAGGAPAGALFSGFGSPVLNSTGQIAYSALLQTGAGGVSSFNDSGIWRSTTLIAREGFQASSAPAGALFSNFINIAHNNAGQVAYLGGLRNGSGGVDSSNNAGIWRDTTLVARRGSQAGGAPAGAVFGSLFDLVLNNAGQIAYRGNLLSGSGGVDSSNNIGIWLDTTLVAREGSQAGGVAAGALFDAFASPVLNDVGQTAYLGGLRSGSGGVDSSNNIGIWLDTTLVARKGSQAGGAPAGALFTDFNSPVLNSAGQTAYFAFLQTGSGGVDLSNDTGIWRDTTLVAREGSQAGGTPVGALFNSFNSPVLNNTGQIAYSASLQTGSGGVDLSNDTGIWRDTTLVAREGSQAGGVPGGALFSSFGSPVLNDVGQTAYSASLQTGAGGVDSTNDTGIWITGPDGQSLLVARKGESLAGKTINSLFLSTESFNRFGQVAYRSSFTEGGSGHFLFTPTVRWANAGSADWDNASNWFLGILPGAPHDVLIDPSASLAVIGPAADTTLTNLTVGGGTGIATLRLNGGAIYASGGVTIESTGLLTGNGVIAGAVINNGTVAAENVTITGPLTNNGVLSGSGRISAALVNTATGEVRAAGGDHLRLLGATNAGRIEAIGTSFAPAEIEFDGVVTNDATTGLIAARNATLRFNSGLANEGAMAMSFGTTDIFGDVINGPTGTIAVAGNSGVTFYDDVTNSGILNVATGSTAVFFGALAGNGNIGGGDVQALGYLLPGASPGLMTFGGDLDLQPTATLKIEIGGTTPGIDYDRIEVGGFATLKGALDVTLIDGFVPEVGDSFAFLFASGAFDASFAAVNLPDLSAEGLDWELNPGGATLFLEVVSALAGDFNLDGTVDAADYTVWRGGLGTTFTQSDYNVWRGNYGATAGAASANSVPEPTAGLLSLIALGTGWLSRRRRTTQQQPGRQAAESI